MLRDTAPDRSVARLASGSAGCRNTRGRLARALAVLEQGDLVQAARLAGLDEAKAAEAAKLLVAAGIVEAGRPLTRSCASHGTVGAGAPSTAKSARPRCGTPRSARFTAAPHVTVTGGTAQSLVGQTTRPDRIQQHTYARCTGSRVTAVGHSWRATSSSRSPTRTDATPRQPPHRECCPPG
jgi:hypothetical protein